MAETFFWVTPAAFAQWLHTQGQEPSPHVAAWFKAKGVAWPSARSSRGSVKVPEMCKNKDGGRHLSPLSPVGKPLSPAHTGDNFHQYRQ